MVCFHMISFNYSAKGVRDVDPRAILCLVVSSVLTMPSV